MWIFLSRHFNFNEKMSQENIRTQQQIAMSQKGAKQPCTQGNYPFQTINDDIEINLPKENFYLKKKRSKRRDKIKKSLRKDKAFSPHVGLEELTFLSDSFRKFKDFPIWNFQKKR